MVAKYLLIPVALLFPAALPAQQLGITGTWVAKVKSKDECAYCHIANAKKDEVWTQFYPLLDNKDAR